MRPTIMITSVLASAILLGVAQDAMSLDLSAYQWKNRLLLLFAPHRDDPEFNALQKQIMAQIGGVNDRDLVIFQLFEQEGSRVDKNDLSPDTVSGLRQQYAADVTQFTVVLIGKDGGVKLKHVGPIDLEDIFARIDSMPMRIQEVRERKP
jgi:hypothetical protein